MRDPISWHAALRMGSMTLVALLVGFVGLSSAIPIQSAIVSSGILTLSQSTHWVQHPTGGKVLKLAVRAGQIVNKDTLLLVLEDPNVSHQTAVLRKSLLDLQARRARLIVQHEEGSKVDFASVNTPSGKVDVPKDVQKLQRDILAAEQLAWASHVEQLQRRQKTLQRQLVAADARIASLGTRLDLFQEDLQTQEALVAKAIVSASSVMPLRHQIAELEGELAALKAEKTAFEGQVLELGLDLARQTSARRAKILSEIERAEQEIKETQNSLSDFARQAEALSLRAPFSGQVHDLRVTTEQTVLRAAEPAMAIVPLGAGTHAKLKVSPKNIDHIYPGQPARVHLDGHAPDIWQTGHVARVSADVLEGRGAALHYFEVDVELSATGGSLGENARLGMPVTAYFATQSSSILSYLLAPFADYARKAFRET